MDGDEYPDYLEDEEDTDSGIRVDAVELQARNELRQVFRSQPERVFYSRQLELFTVV